MHGAFVGFEHSRGRLNRLYDIGKILAKFDNISNTIPTVLSIAAKSLNFRLSVLIEGRENPQIYTWHAAGVDVPEIEKAKMQASRTYTYFANTEVFEGEELSPELAISSKKDDSGMCITLPLALEKSPVFGILLIKCRKVDEKDLRFVSAIAYQISVALDRDYTKKQLLERARAALEARIEAQEAVKTRDAFISVASHELRNPLGALSLQLGLLMKYSPAEERIQKQLDAANRQVNHMTQLVNNLLDVSRITANKLDLVLERFNFSDVVREVINRLDSELKQSGCTITVTYEEREGYWDRMRLNQIVTNLLSNAMKYAKGMPIEIEVKAGAKMVQFTVEDHGIGISTEDQKKIFERFERAGDKGAFIGLGLGLWITKQFVEAMHGNLSVKSQLGVGSVFVVNLPCEKRDT